LAKAWSYSERALELSAKVKKGDYCMALQWKADISFRRGQFSESIVQAQEGRRVANQMGNFFLEVDCMCTQAVAAAALGDFKQVTLLCAEARALLCAFGLEAMYSDLQLMNTEAQALFNKTDYAASLAIHRVCAELTSPTVRPLDHAYALVNIAIIEVITGVPDETILENLNLARDIFTSFAFSRGICNCDVVLADLYYRQGKLNAAQSLYNQCIDSAQGEDAEVMSLCLEKLGDIRWDLRDLAAAFRLRVVYLAFECQGRNAPGILHAFRRVGDVVQSLGDADGARNIFQAALDGFTAMGIDRGIRECKSRLGG
jgi:tetratricopeptide (TPR) repeat protein